MARSQSAAVFGLGSMGFGMACSILKAGHKVHGIDVVQQQVKRFQSQGGETTLLSEAVRDFDAIVVAVLNAIQTEEVLFGSDGIVPRLKKDAVVLSSATVAPNFARDMEARCAEYGVHYLDAPISGGSVKAANGQLTIMASGTPEAFEAADNVLNATAEKVFRLGDSAGAGSAMKAVNQLLAGVHIATMAEAITFGITQGVEPKKFIEVISECAGTSWMLENRAPHIANGDYTPHSQVNIWPKDLGIVLDIAEEANFEAPIAATALKQFLEAADMGLGPLDDAAVAKVYAHKANITLPGEE